MTALKILFVVDGLWVGGTEQSLAAMLPYLLQAGIKPIIACFNHYPKEGVEDQVLRQGFDVRFLCGKGFISRVRELRRLIQLERPDLIHTALFKADVIGRLAAMGSSTAVMTSLVSLPYDPVRFRDPDINPSKLRGVQLVDAWTARYLTTHFHAVSHAAKAAAVSSMGVQPERITVIERGRDPDYFKQRTPEQRQQARLQLGLCEDDEVIVNVGRHEYAKGLPYLLAAMEKLIQRHPRLILLNAGRSGRLTPELERLRDKARLNGQVRFLGHRDDIPEILAAADLFVFPSVYEGLPGAVIEAMGLGLPIVASGIPSIRELVEENCNALLVKPASSSELGIAIERLLKDRERAMAFGRHSREIFEARFTLKQSASRMIELYHQVVALKNDKTRRN